MWIYPPQHGRIRLNIVKEGEETDEAKDGIAKLAKGNSWRNGRNIRTEHIKSFVLFVELEQASGVSKGALIRSCYLPSLQNSACTAYPTIPVAIVVGCSHSEVVGSR
jgi:hypothetical protein